MAVTKGSPSILPQRHKQKHKRYKSTGGYARTLDSVAVQISTNAKPSTYTVSNSEGEPYRRLRRYALILARYQLLETRRLFKRYPKDPHILEVTNRIVANLIYNATFDDDPSDETVFLDPLITALASPKPNREAILDAMAYLSTEAMLTILNSKRVHSDSLRIISELREDVLELDTERLARDVQQNMNSEDMWYRRDAQEYYIDIYRKLLRVDRKIERDASQNNKPNDAPTQQHYDQPASGGLPPRTDEYDEWCTPILAKPPLTVSHSGLCGRKIRPNKEGKYVRDLSRIVTDPQQRVFGKKTRALGGVVVVDCSGSMSLTNEELEAIMEASSGCTVVAYSDGRGRGKPNIWLVANKGMRVRLMPYWGGNNGVDFPALDYARSLRRRNAPMVWISDTCVTGKGSYGSNYSLREQCLRFCRKHNVYIVGDAREAVRLLNKLQRGIRVINKPYDDDDEEE